MIDNVSEAQEEIQCHKERNQLVESIRACPKANFKAKKPRQRMENIDYGEELVVIDPNPDKTYCCLSRCKERVQSFLFGS